MSTARINGIELYYRREGSGEAVVMTHGSWTDSGTWDGLVGALPDGYETIVWDRRGHSRSQDGPGPGGVRQDADDLAALIDQLAIGPVHAVGNSSGGSIVLQLVADRPDLVRTAIVHEPGLFFLLEGEADHLLVEERQGLQPLRALLESRRNREAARYFVEELALGPGAWAMFPPDVQRVLETNAPTFLDEIDEPFDPGTVNLTTLAGSGVPLLVTIGTDSPEILRASAWSLVDLAGCDVVEIEGTGHVPHRTHPTTYAEVVAGHMLRAASVT